MSATIKTSGLLQYKVTRPGTSGLAVNDIINSSGIACADSFTGLKLQRLANRANVPVSMAITGDWENDQYIETTVDPTGLIFTVTMADETTKVVIPTAKNPTTWGSTVGFQTCTFSYTESGVTISASKQALVIDEPLAVYPIGGKIFHIKPESNGTTYIFYDSNGNILYDVSSTTDDDNIEHLSADCALVASYSVIGSHSDTDDKFFVVGIGGQDSMDASDDTKYWTYYDGTSWVYYYFNNSGALGYGRRNTNKVLASGSGAYIKSAAEMGKEHDTVWKWINDIRTAAKNGCSDWYVGSLLELEALRSSRDSNGNKIVTWYNQSGGFTNWTSNEDNSKNARYWRNGSQVWYPYDKSSPMKVGAIRSF